MLLTINKKATQEEIKKMAEDFDGYIKVGFSYPDGTRYSVFFKYSCGDLNISGLQNLK